MTRKLLILLFFIPILFSLLNGAEGELYNAGVSYLLLGEMQLAAERFDTFFDKNPDALLKQGYRALTLNAREQAAGLFRNHLRQRAKSIKGRIGLAISAGDMIDDTTVNTLKSAIQLNNRHSTANLCLGYEYMRRQQYRLAERYFNRALNYHDTPEYYLFLAKLYLEIEEYGEAMNLLFKEADSRPKHAYLNYMAAEVASRMKRPGEAGKFIDRTLNQRPNWASGSLLKAKILIREGQFDQAKQLVATIKFADYNPDLVKVRARIAVHFDEKDAELLLQELFAVDRWDRDVNLLFAARYQKRKQTEQVAHWIGRARLCGAGEDEIKRILPEGNHNEALPSLPFKNVRRLEWLVGNRILVVGVREGGEGERLHIIDGGNLKRLASLTYQGEYQQLYFSENGERALLSTSARRNISVYLYAVQLRSGAVQIKPAAGNAVNIPSVSSAFSSGGNVCNITDGAAEVLLFQSPFYLLTGRANKKPLYPEYHFPLYQYDFRNRRFRSIGVPDNLSIISIPAVQKYELVNRVSAASPLIRGFIQGEVAKTTGIDRRVEIQFGSGAEDLLLLENDRNNQLKTLIIYRDSDKRVIPVSIKALTGRDKYPVKKIEHWNPEKNRLIFSASDSKETLIHFDYGRSSLKKLASGISQIQVDEAGERIYMLTIRRAKLYQSQNNLTYLSFADFKRKKMGRKRDIYRFERVIPYGEVLFCSYREELFRYRSTGEFAYAGPSLSGVPFSYRHQENRLVAFINGRLLLLNDYLSQE